MEYRTFGRTGLRMPVFSCGGMRFQKSWNQADAHRVDRESQANLEAIVERALEVGIHHFETARGYGTSEYQLGKILPQLERDAFLLQTKIPPERDPDSFRRALDQSFERLGVERIDLFSFHGVNHREFLDQVLRPGGCYEVAARLRDDGRIGHIGFSTHAPTPLIVETIATGLFDYVNLHWYYIFQDNAPAIVAAAESGMGVFIISPSDKGGMLYRPPEKLSRLCEPLPPMVFNDLFCLANPNVHTLSIGAARPSDFDTHLSALERLDEAAATIAPIVERLDAAFREAVGEEFAATWREGLPAWEETPGRMNLKTILWLYNLARAFDLVEYGRMRYGLLHRGGGHWFPGRKYSATATARLGRALAGSPHAERIPKLLREAHQLLWVAPPLRDSVRHWTRTSIKRARVALSPLKRRIKALVGAR